MARRAHLHVNARKVLGQARTSRAVAAGARVLQQVDLAVGLGPAPRGYPRDGGHRLVRARHGNSVHVHLGHLALPLDLHLAAVRRQHAGAGRRREGTVVGAVGGGVVRLWVRYWAAARPLTAHLPRRVHQVLLLEPVGHLGERPDCSEVPGIATGSSVLVAAGRGLACGGSRSGTATDRWNLPTPTRRRPTRTRRRVGGWRSGLVSGRVVRGRGMGEQCVGGAAGGNSRTSAENM